MIEPITCMECLKAVTGFASLCDRCRYEVDSNKDVLDAVRQLCDRTGCRLGAAKSLVYESGLYEKREMGPPTFHTLTNRIESWPRPPEVIEVHWDRDSVAWWLVVSAAVLRLGPRRSAENPAESNHLFTVAESERDRAAALGERVAKYFRVPFWFPSPEETIEETPPWHLRHLAISCKACNVAILRERRTSGAELCAACAPDPP